MSKKPLPKFDNVSIVDCPKFSICLEVGANKLTQWGSWMMGWPYQEVYTHAMTYLENGKFLNMSYNAQILDYSKLSKSHRFTIISFTDMTEWQINEGVRLSFEYAKKKIFSPYDVMGYLGFLTRIFPFMSKIKWLKGSNKYKFCSDLVVYMKQKVDYYHFAGIDGNMVSPCDLHTMSEMSEHSKFQNLIL